MSTSIAVWLGLVASSTVAIVVWSTLALDCLGDRDAGWARRLVRALVPPWAALDSLRRGRRSRPLLFGVAVVAYALLQLAAALSA